MSVLPEFRHHRPTSIGEALALVSFEAPVYAGGTELLLAMRAGLFRPDALVDLKRIQELQRIEEVDGWLEIGGTVTHQAVIDDSAALAAVPALIEVLEKVGNPRVRAAGTVGGNLCFSEPKSDVATMLIALEGEVSLESSAGRRSVLVSDYVVGPYTTSREEDEILTSVRIPIRDPRPAAYVKYQTMERPTIGVAAAITSAERCRVVVGAIGGMPEIFEAGSPEELDVAGISSSVEVIPDLTGSERYKRHIVSVYVDQALRRLEGAR